ncbi:MAG: hypothetical protein ACRDXC_05135, partial [Acidimicrobiales bacterium]
DLDLFPERTDGELDRIAIRAFLDHVGGPTSYVVDQATEVTAVVDGVKVSFVGYPFPWTDQPTLAGSIHMASSAAILQMKAYAIGRRGTARDYADLGAGLRAQTTTLGELVNGAKERFALDGEPQFSERLFLQQLAYTADIPEAEKAAITAELTWGSFDDMVAVLHRHVRSYLGSLGREE